MFGVAGHTPFLARARAVAVLSHAQLGLFVQARKRFPQYNMGAFFATENASPLLFCHFSESIHDKMYDQIEDMRHLNRLLVGALQVCGVVAPGGGGGGCVCVCVCVCVCLHVCVCMCVSACVCVS